MLPSLLAAWATPKGIGPYLRQHLLDKTFQGLYHTDAFDRALLVPYFIVLILLAAYGMHRYVLVYLYYKHKKNRTTDPAAYFEQLPRLTVQLPIFNEQYVVERLLDSVCKLKYPREKLDIQVLDDSTDETVEVARGLVEKESEAACVRLDAPGQEPWGGTTRERLWMRIRPTSITGRRMASPDADD